MKVKSKSELIRRDVLRGAGALIGTILLGGSDGFCSIGQRRSRSKKRTRSKKRSQPAKPRKPAVVGPLSGNDLYNDVVSYYDLGEHRTATEGDAKTSDWLAAELRKAGLRTEFQPFTLQQFFASKSSVTVGDRRMRAFPMWPARGIGPIPLRAPLAAFGPGARSQSLKGRIAVIRFPFDRRASVLPEHVKIINDAARAGASAIVAVTEGVTGELIALNTSPSAQPWPAPVALIGGRNAEALAEAEASGAEVSLLLDGRDEPEARARNVIGRLHRGRDLIVVSTPQSGWFRCAGERGPGIALFLGLARWVAKRDSDTSFLFVSTSGHELGNLGMHHFLEQLAPRPERTLVWLHLGAGIATYEWEETAKGMRRLSRIDSNRYLMCSPDLKSMLAEKFAEQPGLSPITDRAVGEMESIKRAGYRAFAIAAGHRFHHTPADNPDTTGPQFLEPVASALVKTLEEIEAKTDQ